MSGSTALGSSPPITARGRRTDDPEPTDGRRAIRARVWIGVTIAVLLLTGLLVQLTTPRTSSLPLSPDNPEPNGARAVAQILSEHGVEVTFVTTTAAALAEAEAGSTLLILEPATLREDQLEALADVRSDVVLAALGGAGDLAPLTDAISVTGSEPRTTLTAGCADPDAEAAGQIVAGGAEIDGEVTTCFAGQAGAGYATWQEGDRTWRAIADGWLLTNAGLPVEGNAALVIRSLGAHDRLVWYLPDPNDTFGQDSGPLELFPLPGPALLQLFVVGLVLVLWRARRLGPVVVEPLPVVVKASETTRGRGRLYRRAGAHAHAAASLRAGLVARVAGRVGLPSHAAPDQVVATLAGASGRTPEAIRDVLYGPPPTTDEGLIALTQALDTLESEVQRG